LHAAENPSSPQSMAYWAAKQRAKVSRFQG